MAEAAPASHTGVSGWLLAGGEGRRVGGADKGLIGWRGAPLIAPVLDAMRPQVWRLGVSANRNHGAYARLLAQALADAPGRSLGVHPDDPDLPRCSGPLAGILTGLRRNPNSWLQLAPCDTPKLPANLVERLLAAAIDAQVDIAVPATARQVGCPEADVHHHWVCALLHPRVTPALGAAFVTGERKVGRWVQTQRWVAVSFATAAEFENLNTLETLDDRD